MNSDMNKESVIDPHMKIESIRQIVKSIEGLHYQTYKIISNDWYIENCIKRLENNLQKLEVKCKTLEDKINRPETKIFFFGRISVGKSEIINAILGMKLLVAVPSHSTSCFVHLKRSINGKWMIKHGENENEFENSDDFKSKMKILSNCHVINNKENLNFDENVDGFIVCDDNNKIFKVNTEIVDCPGSSNKTEITKTIKNHSLDADIFVFVVMNSITDDDRKFFEYQTDQSAKPDIFILINGCDNEDKYENGEIVDYQNSMEHINDQCKKFLQKTYSNDEDVDKRIFMISATEMLECRLKKQFGRTENQLKRCEQFEKFETNLSNYVADPQKNKKRRYNQDIVKISSEVEHEFEKFSECILSQKLPSVLEKYRKKIEALTLLEHKISRNCENMKLSMNENLTNMIDVVDLFDLNVVNNEIKNRYKSFDDQILRFATSQTEEITDFLKVENLNKSFTYSWNENLRSLLKSSIELKSTLESEDNSNAILVARVLSAVPIVSIVSTNLVFNKSEDTTKINEILRKKYIKNLKSELQAINKKKLKTIEKNSIKIRDEIHGNIKEIKSIYQDYEKSFNEYWKEIENSLNGFENDHLTKSWFNRLFR